MASQRTALECAIIPALGTGRGSREYQFFRAAIKWLEGKGKLPKGSFSKYLQEAKRAADKENGIMNWKNVFKDLSGRTPHDMYRSALKKVTNGMWEYSISYEEGMPVNHTLTFRFVPNAPFCCAPWALVATPMLIKKFECNYHMSNIVSPVSNSVLFLSRKKRQFSIYKTCFGILMSSSVANELLTVVPLNLY